MKLDNKKSLLIELLAENSFTPNAENCLLALKNETESNYFSTRPIPVHEIEYIAKKRARLAEKRKYNIYGFNELLSELGRIQSFNVIVHSFEDKEYYFDVFTDSEVKTLLGVIIIEKQNNLINRTV